MDEVIQSLFSSLEENITLPSGEFKGPFVIDHPCTVEGKNTTLWNDNETVLDLKCKGITLKNIRVELINSQSDDVFAIKSAGDCICENIELIGRVSGFGEEDSFKELSKQIKLDRFRSDEDNTFILDLFSPGDSEISTDIADITVEPAVLSPGQNTVKLTVGSLPQNTYIYGDMIVKGMFKRRYYISGISSSEGNICTDHKIELSEKNENAGSKIVSMISSAPQSTVDAVREKVSDHSEVKEANNAYNVQPAKNEKPINNVQVRQTNNVQIRQTNTYIQQGTQYNQAGPYTLRRGERVFIDDTFSRFKIYMGFRMLKSKIDLDPYVFLLNNSGVTSCDSDFVYFGNTVSGCGSVQINKDRSIDLDLNRIPDHISRISLVYSIYLPGPGDNFSKVVDPYIRIFQNGKEKFNFLVNDLITETTMIFVDFYKHNHNWKISAVGFGYREGLKKLCSSYGLIVS